MNLPNIEHFHSRLQPTLDVLSGLTMRLGGTSQILVHVFKACVQLLLFGGCHAIDCSCVVLGRQILGDLADRVLFVLYLLVNGLQFLDFFKEFRQIHGILVNWRALSILCAIRCLGFLTIC